VIADAIESMQEKVRRDRHAIQRITDDKLMHLHLLLIDSEARTNLWVIKMILTFMMLYAKK